MLSKLVSDELVACIKCDALSHKNHLNPGQVAFCPCCGGRLDERKKNSIERTLAVAVAGLLFFIPAVSLPFVGISVAGTYHEASLVDCISLMIDDDFYFIALSVFMFTIAIPVVRLFSAFYLTYMLQTQHLTPHLLMFFRSYHKFDNWTMVHVFLLGIVVSMYKLVSMAEISIGGGLVSLILLLLCSTLVTLTLDQQFIWQKLEAQHVSKR